MKEATQLGELNPLARRAWKRIESDFPRWSGHLDARDGELEFAVPAPSASRAGHLIAFSHQGSLWVRFSPPHMCYLADDENELVSLIQRLTTDQILFKVTMNGDEWAETTLISHEETGFHPGQSVCVVSWSGKFDR
jgi:hypothetical protein